MNEVVDEAELGETPWVKEQWGRRRKREPRGDQAAHLLRAVGSKSIRAAASSRVAIAGSTATPRAPAIARVSTMWRFRLRAYVLLNSRSGALQSLGGRAGAARIGAACRANGIDPTIVVVPGRSIADDARRVIEAGEVTRSG